MKKNFLNKFLYLGFKFGKIFAVLALIILFLVMAGSGLYLFKMNKYDISTPQFEVVRQNIESAENGNRYSTSSDSVSTNAIIKDKIEKKYGHDIEQIVFECKLKPFAYDIIISNIANYDNKYQKKYLEGLKNFITDGQEYLKSKYKVNLENVNSAKEALYGILEEYNTMFSNEIDRIEKDQATQFQYKIIAASILGISILLFVICLFLPLLIKIEENTREFLEIAKRDEND